MIDPKVQSLLEHVVDSPIKLQLVLLFCEHPRLEGTASQIAERIYRDIWSTREALRELAEDGILYSFGAVGDVVYRYRPQPEHIAAIVQLCQHYNEPLERDQVQHIVREIARYAPFRRSSHSVQFERI